MPMTFKLKLLIMLLVLSTATETVSKNTDETPGMLDHAQDAFNRSVTVYGMAVPMNGTIVRQLRETQSTEDIVQVDSQDSGNSTSDSAFTRFVFVIQGIVFPLICVVGMTTNVANLIVLSRPNMRTSTNLFLIALSIADIMMLLIVCMYYVHFKSTHEKPITEYEEVAGQSLFWQLYYYTWFMMANVFLTVSNWLVMAVAFYRYIAVCWPMKASGFCTTQRAIIMIVLAYTLSLALNAPDFATVTIVQDANGTRAEHTELHKSTSFAVIYYNVKLALNIIIPWMVCLILSVVLIIALSRREREVQSMVERENFMPSRADTQRRITIMLVSINIWFLICMVPSFVWYTFNWSKGRSEVEPSLSFRILRVIADLFLVCNYAANFFLYAATNRQYRKTFVTVFCCQKKSFTRGITFELRTGSTSIRSSSSERKNSAPNGKTNLTSNTLL
ncbi:probable G-protein coupled receptor B0563.6 [Lingula anatina]|uniref:Probable G-protein coupled receptor B0563.6 n=1 Tax=Lingula anatina TaxID=7574 RepID=A0A1S3JWI3_LINAN|nr:probable G-protein coupled receptor B0563.6 [Lingula anatina]|eukprot:XP_013414399.1 probable G-protein coupled receptor B0563.6 [Lingula anatina]